MALCSLVLTVHATQAAETGPPCPDHLCPAPSPSIPTDSPSQAPSEAVPGPAAEDSVPGPTRLRYTLGVRLKQLDLDRYNSQTVKLRPVIGLRYGRWKLGLGDGTEWLRFAGFRQEPGLAYDWFDTRRLQFGLSARVQNLSTGENWDPGESGRLTVRLRGMTNVQLNEHWTLGIDLAQDVLDRGDGTMLTLGASRNWTLRGNDRLQFSGGWTAATAEHWRSAYQNKVSSPDQLAPLHGGWGSASLSLGYRHRLSPSWSWFSALGATRAVGSPATVMGSAWTWNAQIGLLYFGR